MLFYACNHFVLFHLLNFHCNSNISLHLDFTTSRMSITEFLNCLSNVCISAILAIIEPSALNSVSMLHTGFFYKKFKLLLVWIQNIGNIFCIHGNKTESNSSVILPNETLHQEDVFCVKRKHCFLLDTLKAMYWIFIIMYKIGTKIFHRKHCIPDKCNAEFWLYVEYQDWRIHSSSPHLTHC